MDQLAALKLKLTLNIWLVVILQNLIIALSFYGLHYLIKLNLLISLSGSLGIDLIVIGIIASIGAKALISPIKALRDAILHISPSFNEPIKAPNSNEIIFGRELITNLIGQIYQISNLVQKDLVKIEHDQSSLDHNFIANSLPLPIFVLDDEENILFANKHASEYIGITINDLIGKNIYTILDMSFPTPQTFDSWLKQAKGKSATSTNSWERVKLDIRDNHKALYFDLAAYYNLDNKYNFSTILTLFDHTKAYSQDDQAVSFIALSVHELRTPLTLLKGYIEVFSKELQGKLDPELNSFLEKMKATDDQLSSFVNNILNVARVDNDQMELHLQSEDWSKILNETISAIEIRAKVRGIQIERKIDDNLPTVAVDMVSIQEVITNLIDNAIKYSGDSKLIKISSYANSEGRVETSIQDFGLGIPESIISNLFTKFYRDHKNRAQIGGTGLGLYLSKSIIDAHQGNIWVHSKEGNGSTFTFTLIPFDQLSKEEKSNSSKDIIHSAHGWIKNHSYYRR